ncbi:MAG: hypothetical protein O2894_13175 [Planctomycetota bacterium]|nr:hypothetical protein [Planctomycetota bacterium]
MLPTGSTLRVLVNVILAGALFRLLGLATHSLWLDEGATWAWATAPTWQGTMFAEANHPPAWWLVTRAWIGAFGSDSEAALRAPAAILGILTIPLAWLLGRRLLDPTHRPARGGFDRTADDGRGARAALWFAGFIALSSYFIEYSQEARMYAALIAESIGLSLLYLRWLDRGDRLSLVAYALLGALALHTQYFALWVLAGHGAHALWLAHSGKRRGVSFDARPFLAALVTAGLLFVPWFIYMATHYEGISTGEPFEPFGRLLYVLWRVGAGPGLVVVDRARLDEGVSAVLEQEALVGAVTALLWFVPIVAGCLRLRKLPGVASFVVCNVAVPIVLLLLVFVKFPLIHERYMVFLAPWLFLLATVGATQAAGLPRVLMLASLLVLLFGSLFAVQGASDTLVPIGPLQALGDAHVASGYAPHPEDPARVLHHGHVYGKEPWRQARAFIRRHAEADDLVVLHPPYLHLVWDYYETRLLALEPRLPGDLQNDEYFGPPLAVASLPRATVDADEVERLLGPTLKDRSRVFLVLAHEETDDPDHYFKALQRVTLKTWIEAGSARVDAPVRPILFDASWGVRVAIFNRR